MPIYSEGPLRHRVRIWHKGAKQDWIVEGTKAEAEIFHATKRLEFVGRPRAKTARVAPTFSDFCANEYRAHAKRQLKSSTWSNRTYTIATLDKHIGGLKLTDLTVGEVERFKQARIDEGMKPSTINQGLKVIRCALAYAHELETPASRAKFKDVPTRGVKRRVFFWDAVAVDKLLQAVRLYAPEIEGLVLCILNTGMRKGEALALERTSIVGDMLCISPSEHWQPKDDEPREIPISSALAPYLKGKRRYVFTNRDGNRFKVWPQKQFDRARKAAGYVEDCDACVRVLPKKNQPNWYKAPVACAKHGIKGGPHTTRHTFAAHFLSKKPDLFLLAKILGHSHGSMTEKYSHLLRDHLAQARNVVNMGVRMRAV